jgi:hypothetical protein
MPNNENTSKQLPNGFYNRGESMDRLETFVAAAFAFAVTTLVIATTELPSNYEEFIYSVKLIPSFAAGFAIVVWIWATHANWCKRYGLEDGRAIILSSTLTFLVLVYIFPLRLIMQGFFAAMTDGFLPTEMHYASNSEVRFMFAFYAIGFFCLALNFVGLFNYAFLMKKEIKLSDIEVYQTVTDIQTWLLTALVALVALLLSLFIPFTMIGWAGYIYFLLFPILKVHGVLRRKSSDKVAETISINSDLS